MNHTDDANRRRQLINDLRGMAAYLEDHAQVPIPRYGRLELQVSPIHDSDASNEREAISEVERIAQLLGVSVTIRSGHHVAELRKGLVVYKAVAIEQRAMDAFNAFYSYSPNFRPEDDAGGAR